MRILLAVRKFIFAVCQTMANLPNNYLLSNISPSGAQSVDSLCLVETACRQREHLFGIGRCGT
jgi:hypothetical protein